MTQRETDVAHVLDTGADVNALDGGRTALGVALYLNNLVLVDLLLKRGADVNRAVDSRGWTPLHLATYHRHAAVVARCSTLAPKPVPFRTR